MSDVKGERTFEVIGLLVDPIANIVEDNEVTKAFRADSLPDGMTEGQYFVKRLRRVMPLILKRHRGDIVAILAAVKGVEPSEYEAEITMAELVNDVYELVTDEALLSFLSLDATAGGSGISSENTEGQPA